MLHSLAWEPLPLYRRQTACQSISSAFRRDWARHSHPLAQVTIRLAMPLKWTRLWTSYSKLNTSKHAQMSAHRAKKSYRGQRIWPLSRPLQRKASTTVVSPATQLSSKVQEDQINQAASVAVNLPRTRSRRIQPRLACSRYQVRLGSKTQTPPLRTHRASLSSIFSSIPRYLTHLRTHKAWTHQTRRTSWLRTKPSIRLLPLLAKLAREVLSIKPDKSCWEKMLKNACRKTKVRLEWTSLLRLCINKHYKNWESSMQMKSVATKMNWKNWPSQTSTCRKSWSKARSNSRDSMRTQSRCVASCTKKSKNTGTWKRSSERSSGSLRNVSLSW